MLKRDKVVCVVAELTVTEEDEKVTVVGCVTSLFVRTIDTARGSDNVQLSVTVPSSSIEDETIDTLTGVVTTRLAAARMLALTTEDTLPSIFLFLQVGKVVVIFFFGPFLVTY